MKNIVRWIYFADCLQCVQSEYKVEDYIHGGEFVILTNRSVTDNKDTLIGLIGKMLAHGISALGINEGERILYPVFVMIFVPPVFDSQRAEASCFSACFLE